MVDVAELTKNIAALAAAPPADLPEPDRVALFGAVTQLRDAIMSPLEATLRYSFATYETAILRLAVDMKIFDVAVPAGGPLSSTEIAEKLSVDAQLVGRVLRVLTGMGLFAETGVDKFAAKPNAAVYCTGSPLKEAVIHLGSQAPAAARLPEYFEKHGYKNPGDAFDGPWQFAENIDKHYFDWLSKRPVLQNAFNLVMGISRMGQTDWFDMYPVEEKLKVSSPDQKVLVDVGGGMGHDVIAFRKKFPSLPGKAAFSDLPAVVDAGKEKGIPEDVEGVGHDFFQPHPDALKGAKAYYLRTVLHDWPDKQARIIVKNVKDAMTKDSILLINENVMPDQGASLYQTQLDMSMMVCFSSLDRTEKQFKELLESEGLKFVQSYKPPVNTPGAPTLLEFVLA